MVCVIGLDLGTTSLTAVIWDVDRRVALRTIQRRNDATLPAAHPSRAEQDPHRLRALALDLLAEAATAQLPIQGIGVTGQAHGLLCTDAQSEPLTPLITWQDRRTAERLPEGATALDQIHARVADLDWRANGCRLAHGYGAATLFWLLQRGALPAGTERVCSAPDWLSGQLAGQHPSTDPTLAASWGVYDLAANAWNAAFLQRLDLPPRLFPPLRPPGSRLGGLRSEVARAVGLPSGLPILSTLGDTQAAFLGSVNDPARDVLVNVGTGGQVCWQVLQLASIGAAVETRPLLGRFLRVGASLCGGAAYAWLNATLRAWLGEFGVEIGEETIYAQLNELAQSAEDTAGIRVRPTFLGSRADPSVEGGAIEGLSLEPLSLGALARATLVGIVDELRDLYVQCGAETDAHAHVVAGGGAVRRNPLLAELIAEQFGMPVAVCEAAEPAAVGAATLAAGVLGRAR